MNRNEEKKLNKKRISIFITQKTKNSTICTNRKPEENRTNTNYSSLENF